MKSIVVPVRVWSWQTEKFVYDRLPVPANVVGTAERLECLGYTVTVFFEDDENKSVEDPEHRVIELRVVGYQHLRGFARFSTNGVIRGSWLANAVGQRQVSYGHWRKQLRNASYSSGSSGSSCGYSARHTA